MTAFPQREKEYFSLFSHAVPVQGKDQAVVIDLQRANYTKIPQFLCEICQHYREEPISTLENIYSDSGGEIVKYFNHLDARKMGCWTDRPGAFPAMELVFDRPDQPQQVVIEYDPVHSPTLATSLDQIIELHGQHLEIWVVNDWKIGVLERIMEQLGGTATRSVTFYLPYRSAISPQRFQRLWNDHAKLYSLVVYGAPMRLSIEAKRIYYVKDKLDDRAKHFRDNPPRTYIFYKDFFLESQEHNPFYNGKICIDKMGGIRNCLTHEQRFGHISEQGLAEIFRSRSFRKLWYVPNDRVRGIQDDPLRHLWLNTHRMRELPDGYYEIIS